MPVSWAVAHAKRLVTITFEGNIRRQDIDDCAAGIMTPATLSYRKIVDLTGGSLPSKPDITTALVDHARKHGRSDAMGPLAIVTLPQELGRQAPLFESLSAAADRSLKVFTDPQAARRWLETIPSSEFPPKDPVFDVWLPAIGRLSATRVDALPAA